MDNLERKSPATAFVERLLRIPPEPAPPAGALESVRTFRAARGFYRYRLARWALKQLSAAAGLAGGIAVLSVVPEFPFKWTVGLFEALAVIGLVTAAPITYLMVHLDYQLRWYIVTDRSLRIREGLVRVREKTMSFANIQNVSIRQGPVQRFFGIADVEVRTAGGGGSDSTHGTQSDTSMHLGYFAGVENAEEIRDAILLRVRQLRDSGLGDPDSEPAVEEGADLLAAAADLLGEARAFRRSLAN